MFMEFQERAAPRRSRRSWRWTLGPDVVELIENFLKLHWIPRNRDSTRERREVGGLLEVVEGEGMIGIEIS